MTINKMTKKLSIKPNNNYNAISLFSGLVHSFLYKDLSYL